MHEATYGYCMRIYIVIGDIYICVCVCILNVKANDTQNICFIRKLKKVRKTIINNKVEHILRQCTIPRLASRLSR